MASISHSYSIKPVYPTYQVPVGLGLAEIKITSDKSLDDETQEKVAKLFISWISNSSLGVGDTFRELQVTRITGMVLRGKNRLNHCWPPY